MKKSICCRLVLISFAVVMVVTLPLSAQIESDRGMIIGKAPSSEVVINIDKELLSFLSAASYERGEGPLQFAVPVATAITPYTHGEIIDNKEETIWRVAIHSEGAKSLSVIFEPFILPEGAALYLYDEDMSTVRGSFTSQNNNSSSILPVMAIGGDRIIVEYHAPSGTDLAGSLSISQVNHDFIGVAGSGNSKDARYGTSQPCNVDVACRENGQVSKVKRSVCRMIVNGTTLCSGVLLNTTDKNRPPLLITAEHCIGNQFEADRTLFIFNYESPWCDGPDGYVSYSMSGAEFLRSDTRLDYTLVRLLQDPPITYRPYYAGWDATNRIPEKTYSIHHPAADVKKITSDNDPPETGSFLSFETNAFWRIVQWEEGSTEGGSSGAPLFTPDGNVTGILSGGSSVCGSPYNDYFLKINSAYIKNAGEAGSFRSYLDPAGIGYTVLNGRDPYSTNFSTIDTLVNFPDMPHDRLTALSPPEFGFTTGHSSDSISGYGEWFENNSSTHIIGIQIVPGRVRFLLNTDSITFRVYNQSGGKPGAILATRRAAMNAARENTILNISFKSPIQVNSGFYIGWSINYTNPVFPDYRQFAVNHSADLTDPALNRAWFLKNNVWDEFLYHPSMPGAYSLNVKAIMAGNIIMTGTDSEPFIADEISVYPNPATDFVNIITGDLTGEIMLSITDIYGRIRHYEHLINYQGTHLSIPVNKLSRGVYLLSLRAGMKRYTCKIIIERK